MPFEFEKTIIEGVIIIKPKIFGDSRGFFLETYKKDDFEKAGISGNFVQDNHSKSKKGVIRGIHMQKGDQAQAKIVRCIKGELLDVAVDLRKNSPSFGKHVAIKLSEENKFMLCVPRGCGHGFSALSDEVEMEYKNDNFYSPADEIGIRWDDPEIGIDWQISAPLVSEKDKILPSFAEFKKMS